MKTSMRALLVDLDDTLFDHTRATRDALARLCESEPALTCWSIDELARRHNAILEARHQDVLAGKLTIDRARVRRFTELLHAASVQDAEHKAIGLARTYRGAYQASRHAVPGAAALLAATRQSGARVVVVTNNVTVEQREKLVAIGLDGAIDALVTSEDVGAQKPSPAIFAAALDAAGAAAHEAVMLGDAWMVDVEGALSAGLRAVWFNRAGAVAPRSGVPELRAFEPLERALAMLQI